MNPSMVQSSTCIQNTGPLQEGNGHEFVNNFNDNIAYTVNITTEQL